MTTTTQPTAWSEARLRALVRPNILTMRPYSSARSEFGGAAEVLLDANESPFDNGHNRYPDPLATELRAALGRVKGIGPEHIVLGNGSDELVDQITRVFCTPGRDAVHALPPTFGMYKVAAAIGDNEFRATNLRPDFSIPVAELRDSWDERSKILWLCSPNNPTGNAMDPAVLTALIRDFPGIVVLDEAYIEFQPQASFLPRLAEFPNMIVTQTLSKAWGMAGVRLGAAYASPFLISLLYTIKMPYNINVLTQRVALAALRQPEEMERRVATLCDERRRLERALGQLGCVEHIFPSVTNFLLVRFADAAATYRFLLERGIVVRNQDYQPNAENCLRITAGTPEENGRLLAALREFDR